MNHAVLLLSLILGFIFPARGQDIRHLYLVAQYPLTGTAEDGLGYQAPVELEDRFYAGPDGIYSTGATFSGSPDSSLIRTPPLEALTDTGFAIQVQFLIDTLDGRDRPVIVAGYDWHYLALYVTGDNRFRAAVNDTRFETLRGISAMAGEWYDLTITYSHNVPGIPVVRFYLGGDLVAQFRQEAIRVRPSDGDITNVHTGIGETFRGWWRDLRVYAAHPVYGFRDPDMDEYQVHTFPNPAVERLTVEVSRPGIVRWSLANQDGSIVRQGIAPDVRWDIMVTGLPAGKYILILRDQQGYPVAQHAVSKALQGR